MNQRPRSALVALLLAAATVGMFGVAHAVTIAPIWPQLVGGIPFALVATASATWAFQEAVSTPCASRGLAFGLLLWCLLLPGAVLRYGLIQLGLHGKVDPYEDLLGFSIPALFGAVLGYALTKRRRAAIAIGVAGSGLTVASAGPLAILSGGRPLELGVALLVICLAAGLLLGVLTRAIDTGTAA